MSDTQRVAIVTGAAGGIGRALVGGLLGAGLRVAAVDRAAGGLAELADHARERQQGAKHRDDADRAAPAGLRGATNPLPHCRRVWMSSGAFKFAGAVPAASRADGSGRRASNRGAGGAGADTDL